jgi:uncharacterized membrane protein YcaP (DUF421 family)
MWKLTIPVWELILRGLAIYLLFILALRLFGKRQLGQFTVFDLALLLLTANSLQPAMTGTDSSLLGGIILSGTLFIGNWSLGWASLRFLPLKQLLQPPPSILARDGRWDRRALRREWIDLDEAEAALRHAGLEDNSQATLVILEADATISAVIPKQSAVRSQERTP